MDRWIQLLKQKEKEYYLLMKCSESHKKTLVRELHAADDLYHLDCWLLYSNCKIQACWAGAIITTLTTILVWCKCNRQHRWFEIAITNMNADQVQVYQSCMLVGASVSDIASS